MSQVLKVVIILDRAGIEWAENGTPRPEIRAHELRLPYEKHGLSAADDPFRAVVVTGQDGSQKALVIYAVHEIPRSTCINWLDILFDYLLKTLVCMQSREFAVIVVGYVPIPAYHRGGAVKIVEEGVSLDGVQVLLAELNGSPETSKGLFEELPRAPLDLELDDEFLASLVHVVRVVKVPTVLLLAPESEEHSGDEDGGDTSGLAIILRKQLGIPARRIPLKLRRESSVREWKALYI